MRYEQEREDNAIYFGMPELYTYSGFYDYDAIGKLPDAAL